MIKLSSALITFGFWVLENVLNGDSVGVNILFIYLVSKECKDYSDSLKPKKEEEVDRSESKVC